MQSLQSCAGSSGAIWSPLAAVALIEEFCSSAPAASVSKNKIGFSWEFPQPALTTICFSWSSLDKSLRLFLVQSLCCLHLPTWVLEAPLSRAGVALPTGRSSLPAHNYLGFWASCTFWGFGLPALFGAGQLVGTDPGMGSPSAPVNLNRGVAGAATPGLPSPLTPGAPHPPPLPTEPFPSNFPFPALLFNGTGLFWELGSRCSSALLGVVLPLWAVPP